MASQTPSVRFAAQHFALVVSDLDRSIEYYRDVFGLGLIHRRAARFVNPTGQLEVAFMAAGPIRLELIGSAQPPTVAIPALPRPHLAFEVPSLQAAIDHLHNHRVSLEILPDPSRPSLAFTVDPDGYLIEIIGRPPMDFD